MKNVWKLALLVGGLSTSAVSYGIKQGSSLESLTISEDEGGLVAGGAWYSDSQRGKVTLLLYVDPDEKDQNIDLENLLKKENFPSDIYNSVAVINLKATWIPNGIIASKLEDKQKKFPSTVYVKDRAHVLKNKWGLADDSYHVVVLDKNSKVVWSKAGKHSLNDQKTVAKIIWKAIKGK